MNDDYDFYDNDKNWAYRLCYGCFIGIMICILIAPLSGCKSIQYVPVPEYHHDSIYFTKVQWDSIYVKDSVYIREYTKGDTVYFEHLKWKTKFVEKLVHDTSYVSKIDSVAVPYPVEKKLGRFDQFKVSYGGYAILLCILLIIYSLRRFIKKLLP